MNNLCELCGTHVREEDIRPCDTCDLAVACPECRDNHDEIVKQHAKLCHIAIDNTIQPFAGVLCRQCGKEARCDH